MKGLNHTESLCFPSKIVFYQINLCATKYISRQRGGGLPICERGGRPIYDHCLTRGRGRGSRTVHFWLTSYVSSPLTEFCWQFFLPIVIAVLAAFIFTKQVPCPTIFINQGLSKHQQMWCAKVFLNLWDFLFEIKREQQVF